MDIRFLTIQIIYYYFSEAYTSEVDKNYGISDMDNQDGDSARVKSVKEANIKDYPYNAFVNIVNEGNCGGTIIGKRWILTAGHCMGKKIIVYVGSGRKYGGTKYEVQNAIQHPSFEVTDGFISYDYMLLELTSPLTYSAIVQPITIGSKGDFVDGEMLTLTGFGVTEKPCAPPLLSCAQVPQNPHLRAVEVPMILHNRCLLMTPRYAVLMGMNSFCAGYDYGRAALAQGNSGSPIVFNKSLLGIVSGRACFLYCNESPEIYSSVPQVLNWIRNVTDI